jgi:hypothetical protein
MSETLDISLDLSCKKNRRFIHAYIRRLLKQYTSENNKRKRLQEENAALRKYIDDTADLVEFAKNVMAIPIPHADTIP